MNEAPGGKPWLWASLNAVVLSLGKYLTGTSRDFAQGPSLEVPVGCIRGCSLAHWEAREQHLAISAEIDLMLPCWHTAFPALCPQGSQARCGLFKFDCLVEPKMTKSGQCTPDSVAETEEVPCSEWPGLGQGPASGVGWGAALPHKGNRRRGVGWARTSSVHTRIFGRYFAELFQKSTLQTRGGSIIPYNFPKTDALGG